jgi:hypothetical protein
MNLKQAQEQFEAQFKTINRDGRSARTDNGLAYICCAGGGVKPEGKPFPVKFAVEDLAAEWWLKSANEIAAGKFNILHWREEPTWEVEPQEKDYPIGAHRYGVVYSRFVTE